MKKLKDILLFILSLLILGSAGFFIVKLIILLIAKIGEVDPNIIVAIIAGTVTIIGYYITRYFEKKKIIEQQIREQKLPVYEEFIKFLFDIFKQTKNNKPIKQDKFDDFFWNLNKKSILWLSDKTLKSYSNWKKLLSNYSEREEQTKENTLLLMIALENLLLDFRRDIGHKNKNIDTGDILSLFITDLNKYSIK